MLRTSGRGWAEPTLEGAGEPRVELAVAPVAVYEALVIIGNIIDKANRLRNAAAGVAAGGAVGALLNEDNADDVEEEQNPAEEDAPDTDTPAPDNDPEGEGPEEESTPLDVLKPEGELFGEPGRRPEVRTKKGGKKAAKELFDRLTKNGTPDQRSNYPGIGRKLENDDWIGYREGSKSGPPSIDLDVKGVPFNKIKFLE